MSTESLPPLELGERLRIARDAVNITQATAAASVGMARTTLVAIEQGLRRLRMDELQQLAQLYGTNANSLLRREAVHVDLVPRFRKMSNTEDSPIQEASRLLADLVRAEVELENLLGVHRAFNYPPERPVPSKNVGRQAEEDALELRQRIGLGLQPILDIGTLLEFEIGVRVYVRKIDSAISGLFAFDERLGACMLLNATHPRDRRTFTAAHELGHLVSKRREPDVFHEGSPEKSPEEKYANAFAKAFLMPSRAVTQKLREVTAESPTLTRRHVIVMAHTFGVSREAMVRRLEELGQTRLGTLEWFEANGGFTNDHVRQVLGDLVPFDNGKKEAARPMTIRITMLAYEARRRELLSEGQLARLLKIDRVELRELLDDLQAEGEAGDEAPVLFR